MAKFKSAKQRKAVMAKIKPKGKLITHKQKKTYWLKDSASGEFEGRDDDGQHPKGTWGKKDKTKARQDERGLIFGRK